MLDITSIPYHSTLNAHLVSALELPNAVILDSGQSGHPDARYSIFSAWPEEYFELQATNFNLTLLQTGKKQAYRIIFNHFNDFKVWFRTAFTATLIPTRYSNANIPFTGGFIGYLSYDLGLWQQPLHTAVPPLINTPLAEFGCYAWAFILDHRLEQAYIVINKQLISEQTRQILTTWLAHLNTPIQPLATPFHLLTKFQSPTDRLTYQQAFTKIQDYIQAGDCYQVNLAQCFRAPYQGSLNFLYHSLQNAAQSPFSAYFSGKSTQLISVSPERFIKCHQNQIETKPIKGTRARHKNPALDKDIALQLKQSVKDRAENLMIVDLLRHDLAQNSNPGSVKVANLFEIESFANVHHLVSTIKAQLREDCTVVDLLLDAFPGGSITGAPKIRAMEIITELEPHNRALYCGSLFYLSSNNRLDSNILIRSFIAKNNTLYCWGGSGIVYNSCEAEEYQECLTKIEQWLKIAWQCKFSSPKNNNPSPL